MKLHWKTNTFAELSTQQLFEILKLRQEIFVVEQECAYPDIDDTDLVSTHLSGHNENNELIAYARLIKPGVSYDQASIGRIVVSPKARGQRLGVILMHKALEEMESLFPQKPIKIGAQQHLEKFYNRFRF